MPGTGWATPPTKRFDIRGARGTGVSVDPELRELFAGDSVLNAHRLLADLSAAYFDVANAREDRGAQRTPRCRRAGTRRLEHEHPVPQRHQQRACSRTRSCAPATSRRSSTFRRRAWRTTPTTATPAQGVLTRTLRPELPKALGQYPIALREAHARLGSFSGLLVADGAGRTAPLRELLLVSGDDRLDSNERDAYLNQVIQTVERGSKGVTITGPLQVTLTAARRPDPDHHRERPGQPHASRWSSSCRAIRGSTSPTGAPRPYELAPGTNRFDIRVRSRTPGVVPRRRRRALRPDGVITLATARYKIRSLALSGVGLGISIAALAVLVTWWIRHHRRAKRARIAHELTGAT